MHFRNEGCSGIYCRKRLQTAGVYYSRYLDIASKERYEGFVEGLEENGISFNKRMHYAGTFSVETGQIGSMTLLQRNPEIDCIVCGNDLMAIGAVSVCEKLGEKIPKTLRSWNF